MTEESSGVVEKEVVNKATRISHIRLSIKAAQLHCTKAVKKKKEYHQVFKCLTVLYDHEQ
jgi:hypothetical protein